MCLGWNLGRLRLSRAAAPDKRPDFLRPPKRDGLQNAFFGMTAPASAGFEPDLG
jgi:hypothetical protein